MPPRSLFSLAFQRRIAKAALHRRLPPLRPLHSTLPSLAVLPKLSPIEAPNSTALSALLSRLSLRSDPSLHPALLACLTHPSFSSSPRIPTNEVLSSLGNALLGLFTSEHLAYLFPLLPTEALKSAVTAYVGPNACFSVARELGVAVQAGGNMGLMGEGAGMASAGVALRWKKEEVVVDGPERTPVAKRFRRFRGKQSGQGLDRSAGQEAQETGQEDQAKHRTHGRESFEEMVATSVKAFVGLIYQERVSWKKPSSNLSTQAA